MNRRSLSLLSLLFLLTTTVVTSCADPTPEPLPPQEIIAQSAGRMKVLDGFYFVIDRTGSPVFLDPDETISFRRAEGFYAAPDRARANVRIIGPGLVTEVGVVSIGQTQWETNVLSGDWRELPPDWGFNPAVLFDPEIGIQAILVADLNNLALHESEKLEDGPEQNLYVVEGTLSGNRIYEMSYGLIGPDDMTVRLWVMPETFELVRAMITDPNRSGGEATIWRVEFSQFGKIVDIVPPQS